MPNVKMKECSICANDTLSDEPGRYVKTICSHIFHHSCLSEWLKINNSCPHCRINNPTMKYNKYYITIQTICFTMRYYSMLLLCHLIGVMFLIYAIIRYSFVRRLICNKIRYYSVCLLYRLTYYSICVLYHLIYTINACIYIILVILVGKSFAGERRKYYFLNL